MIRISTNIDVSPETARTMAEAFEQMAASDETIDDADGVEVKGLFAALAEAIRGAQPITYSAVVALDGDALKTDVLREKGAALFLDLDAQARELGVGGRCVRAELALLYVVDEGVEAERVALDEAFAPREPAQEGGAS